MTAAATPREPQTSHAVLMVRPAHFAANAETAGSNHFQRHAGGGVEVAARAAREFDALAVALAAAGVRVHAFAGRTDEALPDEVFPNNWLSLHADGTAVLYPMLAPSRRRERRADVLDALRSEHGYRISRVLDLTTLETGGGFLEGTGSVVLDRTNRVAYACLSPRTRPDSLAAFGRELGYDTLAFDAADARGTQHLSHQRAAIDRHAFRRALHSRTGRRSVAGAGPARGERPRDRRPDVRAARGVRGQLARAARPRQRDRAVADGVRLARRGAAAHARSAMANW